MAGPAGASCERLIVERRELANPCYRCGHPGGDGFAQFTNSLLCQRLHGIGRDAQTPSGLLLTAGRADARDPSLPARYVQAHHSSQEDPATAANDDDVNDDYHYDDTALINLHVDDVNDDHHRGAQAETETRSKTAESHHAPKGTVRLAIPLITSGVSLAVERRYEQCDPARRADALPISS